MRRFRFTEAELADMERMYRAGDSTIAIAAKYGCHEGSVWSRLKARGVPIRSRNHRKRRVRVSEDGYAMFGDTAVHRVVAAAWIGRDLLPGEVVHHRDGDKLNNHPENLEVLPSQSVHTSKHGITRSTLDRGQADEIRRRWESGRHTMTSLAQRFGVGRSTVARIVYGRSWR